MARCGVVQNIVRHVLEPTIGQQLLGFKPLKILIESCYDGGSVTYYGHEQEVGWYTRSINTSYYLGPRGRMHKGTAISIFPPEYQIRQGRTHFFYSNNNARIEFQSRNPISALISRESKKYVIVRVDRRGPFEICKKLLSPDLKLDGSLEDAQLALKYLLNLKDQMTKLGY